MNQLRKARLLWHCRRGMLELDLLLEQFNQQCLDTLDEPSFDTYERLLTCTDPELFAWLMGHEQPEDKELLQFVQRIRDIYPA